MVEAMHRSVAYWLLAEYKRQLPRVENLMANDASPARNMLSALRAQMRRHRDAIDDKAEAYADWFAKRSNAAATAAAPMSTSPTPTLQPP